MAGIIGLLPTFVHLSLGVFFLGLIIFLHDLSLIIGIIVDLMIFLTIGSYTVVNLLPIWFTDCPYRTPLTYPCTIVYSIMRIFLKFMPSTRPSHLDQVFRWFSGVYQHITSAVFLKHMSELVASVAMLAVGALMV